MEKLEISRKDVEGHLDLVQLKARELSGYAAPGVAGEPVFRGRYQREACSIEMYALEGEGDCVIPLLVFVPNGDGKFPAVVYLHPEGKAADAAPGGEIEKLVNRGLIVAAPDLTGTGETEDKSESAAYAAVLIGKSIVGIQAGDIVRVVNMLKDRSDVISDNIGAVSIDEMCPALLHAAAFDPSIKNVVCVGSPISYSSMVMNRFYDFDFSCAVAGALTAYDLPDLAGCIAPGKLLLMELKDPVKQPATEELVKKEFAFPRTVYSMKNAPENLKCLFHKPDDYMLLVADWLLE